MDGALDCVDLRGLSLLVRCRTLRRDDAERARSEARRKVDTAEAEARAADERLAAHRRAWRAQEVMAAESMMGHILDGSRFRQVHDQLDAMADTAVKLQAACQAARKRIAAAEQAAAEARLQLAARQRRLEQSDTIRARVSDARATQELASEEQELDDDLSQRYGRRN